VGLLGSYLLCWIGAICKVLGKLGMFEIVLSRFGELSIPASPHSWSVQNQIPHLDGPKTWLRVIHIVSLALGTSFTL
jgi:hypothetical protein